jgi:hypothetical protein
VSEQSLPAAPTLLPRSSAESIHRLLTHAITALDATSAECAFITVSAVSVHVTRNQRVHAIGYATTAEAHQRLADASAECIVPSLADLTLRLQARPLSVL